MPGTPARRNSNGTAREKPVNGNRRPSTGGYRAQRRGGGGGKAVLFVLVLLVAGAAGAGYALKDDLFPSSGRTTKPPVEQPPDAPVERPPDVPVERPPDVPVERPPDVPVERPPDLAPATPDNAAAEQAIASGQQLLAALNYKSAADIFGKVGSMRCSDELSGRAAGLVRKAQAFEKLTGEVKVRADAGEKIQIVVVGDREIRGVVRKNADGSVTVLQGTAGGGQMSYTFQPSQISAYKEVDPAERIGEIRTDIDRRLERLGADPAPPQVVDVAVFALENGLKEDGHKLLDRAWSAAERVGGDGANGKGLLPMVAEHRAGKLFSQADWYDSVAQEIFARTYCQKILDHKEYSKTSYAEAARKLLAMMDERKGIKNYKVTYKIHVQETPPKPPDPIRPMDPPPSVKPKEPPKVTVSNISSGKADLSEANRYFEEAMQYYAKGMATRGTGESKGHLAKAGRLFGKAGKIYEAAQASDPANSMLESRVVDCNRFRYACMKHSTL